MLQRAFETRTAVSRTLTYPAPSGGWVQSGNIVTPKKDQAEQLDNLIPTAQGARLRGGALEFADIGASVVSMFTYASGGTEDFFAATATGVYDVGRVNVSGVTATFADVEGLGSGDWSATQISTSGGQFVVAVNGSDYAMYWDGAEWNPIADVAINDVGFDAETSAFAVGETATGGTSGASADIYAITKSAADEGVLKVGTITSGPFQDNEALTDGATGAATADGASSSASSITITNVATTALSQVWLFKERLFFVEKNSASAWYLPVESIGGAASEIDLGAVFAKGGNLLFGATWSLDSGSGLDDVCLFVSNQGEIAVYEGTDPSNANTWSLVGVYQIGKPLNKNGFFRAGGDLAILTEDGIIPVSEALRKDRAALQAGALTYPIEDAWREVVQQRTTSYPISATLWQSGTILLVGTPGQYLGRNVAFAANARTGAWCRITGWDVRCSVVYADELYFADQNGKVLKADTGGTDDGKGYAAVWVPKFQTSIDMGDVNAVGVTYRASDSVEVSLEAHADYDVDTITEPPTIAFDEGDVWGSGVWGTFIWGSVSELMTHTDWQAAYANGYAFSFSMALTSNQTTRFPFEVLIGRARVEKGYAL